MLAEWAALPGNPSPNIDQLLLRMRNSPTALGHLPATTPPHGAYIVRMRNSDTWSAYVKTLRERAGLSQAALGEAIGLNRSTVWRWETGKSRPDDIDVIARVAHAVRSTTQEAMAAAGLAAPTDREPDDPELQLILEADVSQEVRKMMIQRLEELRRRDRERRMDEIRWGLRTAGGGR